MPIPFLFHVLENGPPPWVRNNVSTIVYTTVVFAVLALLKIYTTGSSNTADRPLHGRVVIVTGGTSGVGARTAFGLAKAGAQIILLTKAPPSDPFLADYVQDLRDKTNNQLIYAEQVDLASLHSIRKFATKWIDNAPPRRLDMMVLCAAALTPPGGKRRETREGLEETWMVNYLANFHLLGIMSPAIRAQPFDRDVRILMATCSSYIASPSLKEGVSTKTWSAGKAYARSKLALNVFGQAFQKHIDSYKRPDGIPVNARVIFVDPGLARTPGMVRWITRGSLWGLALYLLAYPVAWILLKSSQMAAQSFLYAAMEPSLGRDGGGRLVKECTEVDFARAEVKDEDVAKKLWEESDALIERVEKIEAKKRAAEKAAEKIETDKKEKDAKEREQKDEVEGLVNAIKKGKQKEKEKQKNQGKSKKTKRTET